MATMFITMYGKQLSGKSYGESVSPGIEVTDML